MLKIHGIEVSRVNKFCQKTWHDKFGFDGQLDKPEKLRTLMKEIREKEKSNPKKEDKYGLHCAKVWYNEPVKRREGG